MSVLVTARSADCALAAAAVSTARHSTPIAMPTPRRTSPPRDAGQSPAAGLIRSPPHPAWHSRQDVNFPHLCHETEYGWGRYTELKVRRGGRGERVGRSAASCAAPYWMTSVT